MDKNSNDTSNRNLETYREAILEILNFENKAKSIIDDIKKEEQKSEEKKEELRKKFKEEQKSINIKKDTLLRSIERLELKDLTKIVEILQEIYFEQRELKPLVKKLLTTQTFRKRISYFRKKDFKGTYPLIEFINKKFPVDDYPMYTLNPKTPIYGSEVEKTKNNSTSLPPLSNDEILSCLDVFVEKNKQALYSWVMEIFSFDADLIVNGYKEKYVKERQELLLSVIEKTKRESKYQMSIAEKLFINGDLAKLVSFQIKGSKAETKIKLLEEKIVNLENETKEKETSYWERAGKQKSIIDEQQIAIDELHKKMINYEELSVRLAEYMKKYEAQISMNERITIENDIRIHDAEENIRDIEGENSQLREELTDVKLLYENVKSDLSLKLAEIKRLKDDTNDMEIKAKESVLQDLVSAIKDQLFYIVLYYLELTEEGHLAKDSLEMFGDTINNINIAFRLVGIEIFGTIDEVVCYDSSLHDSMGYKMSNGEKVILRVPGWKINGNVYVKAQVEKEN